MADPKVGTGKKPRGSGRRLYTDENPKETGSRKGATPAEARRTGAKGKKGAKTGARKRQSRTGGEQRAKGRGKAQGANRGKKGNEASRRKQGKKTGEYASKK